MPDGEIATEPTGAETAASTETSFELAVVGPPLFVAVTKHLRVLDSVVPI